MRTESEAFVLWLKSKGHKAKIGQRNDAIDGIVSDDVCGKVNTLFDSFWLDYCKSTIIK